MLCAAVDQAGYIVEAIGETYPDCSQFVLVTAAQVDRLTYWADLSIALEPGGDYFLPLLGAFLTAVGVVLGLRLVVDIARTSSEEA